MLGELGLQRYPVKQSDQLAQLQTKLLQGKAGDIARQK